MNKKDKYQKFFDKIVNKMFQMVGFGSFDQKFVDKYPNNWYQRKTWKNKEQETEWKSYFIKEARNDLKISKKSAEKEYSYFNLMWGWKSAKNNI